MDRATARFIVSFTSPTIFLLLLCLVTGMPLQVRASSSWTQISTNTIDYGAVATSDTGQDVIYSNYNGDVWLSQDYGATWTDTLSEPGDNWGSLAMSSNGQTLLAAQDDGDVWISQNGGIAWYDSGLGTDNWFAVTMSEDGSDMAAITGPSDNEVEVSTDSGNTWTSATSTLPADDWKDISYSPDGSLLVLTSSDNPGDIFFSTDNGTDWSPTRPPVTDTMGVVAAGESNHTFVDADGEMYKTNNEGFAWSDTGQSGNPDGWSAISLSYDDSTVFASSYDGFLDLSTDGGNTWQDEGDPGSGGWNSSAISGDGTHLYAASGYAGLWRYGDGEDTTPPVITILGANPASLSVGQNYLDAGATANDAVDGDVTSSIVTTSNVTTSMPGTYTVTYAAHDSSGNYATSTRTVSVTAQTSSTGSTEGGGTSIIQQVQNLIATGKTELAQSIKLQWPSLFGSSSSTTIPVVSTTSSSAAVPVRDLTLGAVGTDVKALQVLLNANGFPVTASGPGSKGNETSYFGVLTRNALAAYQKAHGISPATGYFGSLTRAEMKSTDLKGLWW